MWRPLEWLATGRPSAAWCGGAVGPLAGVDAPASSRAPIDQRFVSTLSPGHDASPPFRQRLVVKIVAGPFGDLGAVRMLREALAQIEGVETISLSGLSHHHVQFEGWFGHERELIAELERTLPFAFEVQSASGVQLGLRLRA